MPKAPRVQFDNDIHPVISSGGGGVYNLRQRSHTGSIRAESLLSNKELDLEGEISNVEDRDIAKKQVRRSHHGVLDSQ